MAFFSSLYFPFLSPHPRPSSCLPLFILPLYLSLQASAQAATATAAQEKRHAEEMAAKAQAAAADSAQQLAAAIERGGASSASSFSGSGSGRRGGSSAGKGDAAAGAGDAAALQVGSEVVVYGEGITRTVLLRVLPGSSYSKRVASILVAFHMLFPPRLPTCVNPPPPIGVQGSGRRGSGGSTGKGQEGAGSCPRTGSCARG